MSTLDRTSDKPVVCRYDSSITKEHANKHYPVLLDIGTETGSYDHPEVSLQASAADNTRVWAELGSVDPDTGTCQVYTKGLMYFRAAATYDKADNGKPVLYSGTKDQVKVLSIPVATDFADLAAATAAFNGLAAMLSNIVNAPILEGGFTIQEDGNTVNILKCRR